MNKSIFQIIIITVVNVLSISLLNAQTPFDSYAPPNTKNEMLKLEDVSYRAYNTDSLSQVRYIELDKEKLAQSCNNNIDSLFRIERLRPFEPNWWTKDPKMAKYPSMSPYNAFANNPILYTDFKGDVVEAQNVGGMLAIIKSVETKYQDYVRSSFGYPSTIKLCDINGNELTAEQAKTIAIVEPKSNFSRLVELVYATEIFSVKLVNREERLSKYVTSPKSGQKDEVKFSLGAPKDVYDSDHQVNALGVYLPIEEDFPSKSAPYAESIDKTKNLIYVLEGNQIDAYNHVTSEGQRTAEELYFHGFYDLIKQDSHHDFNKGGYLIKSGKNNQEALRVQENAKENEKK